MDLKTRQLFVNDFLWILNEKGQTITCDKVSSCDDIPKYFFL